MSDFRTIATIRKNNSQELRVGVALHDGWAMVDLRVFKTPRTGMGEPIPTKAGICITRAKLTELIQALQAAEREMQQ